MTDHDIRRRPRENRFAASENRARKLSLSFVRVLLESPGGAVLALLLSSRRQQILKRSQIILDQFSGVDLSSATCRETAENAFSSDGASKQRSYNPTFSLTKLPPARDNNISGRIFK